MQARFLVSCDIWAVIDEGAPSVRIDNNGISKLPVSGQPCTNCRSLFAGRRWSDAFKKRAVCWCEAIGPRQGQQLAISFWSSGCRDLENGISKGHKFPTENGRPRVPELHSLTNSHKTSCSLIPLGESTREFTKQHVSPFMYLYFLLSCQPAAFEAPADIGRISSCSRAATGRAHGNQGSLIQVHPVCAILLRCKLILHEIKVRLDILKQ
jgi:hypothetical protein